MRCRNCGQTRRITLLIDLGVQVAVDGAVKCPTWAVSAQCPICHSTDVVADHARLFARTIDAMAR